MADCLQYIIGLTDKDCSCYEDDKPVDFDTINASETGYYVTDYQYGFPILEKVDNTQACGDGTIWERLVSARSKAITAFRSDMGAKILSTYRNRLQFQGLIGKTTANSVVNPGKDYVGVALWPNQYRDAKFVLQAIYLGIDTAASVDVTIRSNEGEEVDAAGIFTTQTVMIDTTANKFTRKVLDTEIEIPFWSLYMPGELKYYLYYEMPTGAKALNNNFTCCNHTPQWRKHMEARGIETDDPNNMPDTGTSTPWGIVLEGYYTCSVEAWLCRMDEIAGYSAKSVVGRAIQHKAASLLIHGVVASAKENKFTITPKDQLLQEMRYHEGEYYNAVEWIAQNLPREAVDCLTCTTNDKFKTQSLIV